MAKIHNPQDQNGIDLINQTILDGEVADLIDKISEEEQARITADEELTKTINDEITRAKAEELRLDTAINGEIVRAEKAESDLKIAINDEIARAKEAELSLDSKISSEIANERIERIAADTELDNSIKTETANREKQYGSLKKEIDTEVAERKNAILKEVNDRDEAISTAITEEVADRNEAISKAIEDEVADRNAAIAAEAAKIGTAIEDAIAAEVTNRNAAIAEKVEEETTRATAAESDLSAKINNSIIITQEVTGETSPINVRGFGDVIQTTGLLSAVTLYCPSSQNTSYNTWLKVFEKTDSGNVYRGISDSALTHGANETLTYTFQTSDILLEATKTYFFVFATDSQKASTSFAANNDSTDCCIKAVARAAGDTCGICGSTGFSPNTSKKAKYNLIQVSTEFNTALSTHSDDNKLHFENDEKESLFNDVNSIIEFSFSDSNQSEAAPASQDNADAMGIKFTAPASKNVKRIKIACRASQSTGNTNPVWAKIWDLTNGFASATLVTTSNKAVTHRPNGNDIEFDIAFDFDDLNLVAGNIYGITNVDTEENKNSGNITAGAVKTCYRTFNIKNSGIFKAAFINDAVNGEHSINHSPIFALEYNIPLAEEINKKQNIEDALTITDVNNAINEQTTDLVDTTTLSNILGDYVPQTTIFKLSSSTENIIFEPAISSEQQTITVSTGSDFAIFAANAVSSNSIISVAVEPIVPGQQELNINISLQETPTATTQCVIIVDTICDNANYNNSQHVAKIIPVQIIVAENTNTEAETQE